MESFLSYHLHLKLERYLTHDTFATVTHLVEKNVFISSLAIRKLQKNG